MKIRFCLLIGLLVAGFTTTSYAATLHQGQGYSKFGHQAKNKVSYGKKYQNIHFVKKPVHNVKVSFNHKHYPNFDKKHIDTNKIVNFDFNKNIQLLSSSHDDKGNVYLQICKDDKNDNQNYGNHDNDHGQQGGANAVPVPAAIWLFGSALMGLTGISRRSLI